MAKNKNKAVEDITLEQAQTESQAEETVEEATETSEQGASEEEQEETKDPKDAKIEELNDRLVRNMAEFDNFRKRSEKEKAQMFEIGAKSIIEKILPVIDYFERGLGTVSEEEKESV